jgi:hypothetical protein
MNSFIVVLINIYNLMKFMQSAFKIRKPCFFNFNENYYYLIFKLLGHRTMSEQVNTTYNTNS